MAYFILKYEFADDYLNRRTTFRAEHLKLAAAAVARGELLLGGACGDPITDALLVFQATEGSIVTQFVDDDPYVKNGIVIRWTIEPWHVVVGSLAQSNLAIDAPSS